MFFWTGQKYIINDITVESAIPILVHTQCQAAEPSALSTTINRQSVWSVFTQAQRWTEQGLKPATHRIQEKLPPSLSDWTQMYIFKILIWKHVWKLFIVSFHFEVTHNLTKRNQLFAFNVTRYGRRGLFAVHCTEPQVKFCHSFNCTVGLTALKHVLEQLAGTVFTYTKTENKNILLSDKKTRIFNTHPSKFRPGGNISSLSHSCPHKRGPQGVQSSPLVMDPEPEQHHGQRNCRGAADVCSSSAQHWSFPSAWSSAYHWKSQAG